MDDGRIPGFLNRETFSECHMASISIHLGCYMMGCKCTVLY